MKANWILVSLFFIKTLLATDASYFEEKSDALAENTSAVLSELKQKAVVHWAEHFLGDRFSTYEKLFTPEACEKFITDYKVNRNAQTKALEISGHLDIMALRRWLQLEQAKGKNVKEQALQVVISSQIPEVPPTQEMVSTPFVANLISHVHALTAKYHLKNYPLIISTAPPKTKGEIEGLKGRLTSPLVLWLHLRSGRNLRVIEIDEMWLLTSHSKMLKATTEEINFGNQPIRTSKEKSVLRPIYQQIASDFEDIVVSNLASNSLIYIRAEQIEPLKKQNELQGILEALDSLSSVKTFQKDKTSTVFEAFSALPIESAAAKIKENLASDNGYSVTLQDAKTILVRYSK